MAETDNRLLAMLGLRVTGDAGPWTFYFSSRKQIVFYPRMPADKPASPAQVVLRAYFKAAAMTWRALPIAKQKAWERASKRAWLRCTGYNLWTYYAVTSDRQTINTIERQSGVSLLT